MYTPPPLDYFTPPEERPHTNLPLPAGVSQADWDAVTWQIWWEMSWVLLVNDWFGTKTSGLITDIYLGQDLTVQTVGNYLNLPSDSSDTVGMSLLSLLFNGAWAALGFPGLGEGAAAVAALAGILATAFAAAATSLPGGGSIQVVYADLQST